MRRRAVWQALALLIALALAPGPPVQAQTLQTRAVYNGRDVSETSFTYCYLSTTEQQGLNRAQTAGSSATVTAVNGTPFDPVEVKDELVFYTPLGPLVRYITAKASGASITVNTALDITGGVAFGYKTYGTTCGTTAESGWITLLGRSTVAVTVATLAGTSIDYSIEYRTPPTTQIQGKTGSIASATFPNNSATFNVPDVAAQIRVGLKVSGDAGVQSVAVSLANVAGNTSWAGGGSGGAATSVSAAAFPLRAPDGTPAVPSYSFINAPSTGIHGSNAPALFLSVGGNVRAIYVAAENPRMAANGQIGWSSNNDPTLAVSDTGLARTAAGVSRATLGGANDGWIQNTAGDQFLTADHTNATATPTNLTDLTVNVTNGRKYTFVLTLMVSQSVAADGARLDFEGGTATATNFRSNVTILDGAAYDTHTSVTALATDVTSTDIGTTVLIQAVGSFEPSSTGTFIPRIGLEAASTGTITTFRGSSLLVNDMP